MILDNDLWFASAQAITDDVYATSPWDKGAAGALGSDLWAIFRVHTAFVSAGGAKLQIELRTSDALSGSDLDSSYVKLLMSQLWAVTDLTINNEVWKVKLPRELKRYVQPYYEVSTSTFSAGKLDAFLSASSQRLAQA